MAWTWASGCAFVVQGGCTPKPGCVLACNQAGGRLTGDVGSWGSYGSGIACFARHNHAGHLWPGLAFLDLPPPPPLIVFVFAAVDATLWPCLTHSTDREKMEGWGFTRSPAGTLGCFPFLPERAVLSGLLARFLRKHVGQGLSSF